MNFRGQSKIFSIISHSSGNFLSLTLSDIMSALGNMAIKLLGTKSGMASRY